MDDRKLLELAAQAAGKNNLRYNEGKSNCYYASSLHYMTGPGHKHNPWNPLTDDGDALRLAVKLGISVEQWPSDDTGGSYASCMDLIQDHADDAMSATRRVIVRAAAKIGAKQSK